MPYMNYMPESQLKEFNSLSEAVNNPPIKAECFELLELIAGTNNYKLLNCRMTKRQQSLLPYMRSNGWVRTAHFLTSAADYPDSHAIAPAGFKWLNIEI